MGALVQPVLLHCMCYPQILHMQVYQVVRVVAVEEAALDRGVGH